MANLVRNLLSMPGSFEICVHIDGSTDGTEEALSSLTGASRLKITRGENKGVGHAQLAAIRSARGKFIMKLDDEDQLYSDGLSEVLSHCAMLDDDAIAGFLFQMDYSDGRTVTRFPTRRSNLVKVRADEGVIGDKKEVVRRDYFNSISTEDFEGSRLVPMSLYWARLSRHFDVICCNTPIGAISYSLDGVSSSVRQLAKANPKPLYLAYRAKLGLFFAGRYRSPAFALQCVLGAAYYGALSVTEKSLRWIKPIAVAQAN